jgi:hypothetical protein
MEPGRWFAAGDSAPMIPATYHPTWPLAAMPPLASHANLGVWKLLRSEKDEVDER